MPKLTGSTMETRKIGASNFNFTGARIDSLGATEYTLVTIAVDVTGSVLGFKAELRQALVAAVESCKKSPRSDNLLLRVVLFSTTVGGVSELHGFKPLADVDPNGYADFSPDGYTPLYDAAYSAVGATVAYGKDLSDNDYLANGIVFVITDGDDNASVATPAMIRKEIESVRSGEKLESLVTILIGVNAQSFQGTLEQFRDDAGIDEYIDVGEASKAKLAKLAAFVSRSVSSQSQALGTGGPSQNIQAVI